MFDVALTAGTSLQSSRSPSRVLFSRRRSLYGGISHERGDSDPAYHSVPLLAPGKHVGLPVSLSARAEVTAPSLLTATRMLPEKRDALSEALSSEYKLREYVAFPCFRLGSHKHPALPSKPGARPTASTFPLNSECSTQDPFCAVSTLFAARLNVACRCMFRKTSTMHGGQAYMETCGVQ